MNECSLWSLLLQCGSTVNLSTLTHSILLIVKSSCHNLTTHHADLQLQPKGMFTFSFRFELMDTGLQLDTSLQKHGNIKG